MTAYQRVLRRVPPGWPAESLMRSVDVFYSFRMHLVWRWTRNGQSMIYTLAILDWSVQFLADGFVAGRGVTRVAPGARINYDAELTRTSEDPQPLSGAIANATIVVRDKPQ